MLTHAIQCIILCLNEIHQTCRKSMKLFINISYSTNLHTCPKTCNEEFKYIMQCNVIAPYRLIYRKDISIAPNYNTRYGDKRSDLFIHTNTHPPSLNMYE